MLIFEEYIIKFKKYNLGLDKEGLCAKHIQEKEDLILHRPEGRIKGIPDFYYYDKYTKEKIWIEIKADSDGLRKHQLRWIANNKLEKVRVIYFELVEDSKAKIQTHLKTYYDNNFKDIINFIIIVKEIPIKELYGVYEDEISLEELKDIIWSLTSKYYFIREYDGIISFNPEWKLIHDFVKDSETIIELENIMEVSDK